MRAAAKILVPLMCLTIMSPAQDFGLITGNFHNIDSLHQGDAPVRLDSLDLDIEASGGLLKVRVAAVLSMADTFHSYEIRAHKQQTCADHSPGSECMEYLGYDTTWVDRTLDTLDVPLWTRIPLDGSITGVSVREQGREIQGRIVPKWAAGERLPEFEASQKTTFQLWEGQESVSLVGLRFRLGETKRIHLYWIQAIHEGMDLPISASVRLPYPLLGIRDTGHIGHVRIATKADVASGLVLDLGERGSMPIGPSPATRTWTNPGDFVFRVTGSSPSVWAANDGVKGAFGSRMAMSESDIKFQAEPSRRLVVLDVAGPSLSKGKKLALLALLEYGQKGSLVNLAWRTDTGMVRLWKDYSGLDAERGSEVVAFLKTWSPPLTSTPMATLSALADSDSGAAMILISSESSASVFDYQGKVRNAGDPEAQSAASKWNALKKRLEAKGHVLFGWWSNENLDMLAWQTRGFSFGNIGLPQNGWSRGGKDQSCTYTPKLFGVERPGGQDPTDIQVHVEGLDVDSLAVFPLDGSWPQGWKRIYTVFNGLTRSLATTGTDSLRFVISGRHKHGGTAKVVLSGVWKALPFTGTAEIDVPEPPGAVFGNQIWARDYAQMLQTLAPWCGSSTWNQLRQLGQTYKIASPATAFVGVPVGIALPDSFATSVEMCSDSFPVYVSTQNAPYQPVFQCSRFMQNLDSSSLDDLLAGRIVSVKRLATPAVVGLRIRSGSTVDLEVLGHDDGSATVRIVDLNGREVAKMSMTRSGDRWTSTWKPTGRGVFFAVAEGSRWKHTSRFTAGR